MERREFLKAALGFTAAAAAIAGTAMAVQAAPILPSDMPPANPSRAAETAVRQPDKAEPAVQDARSEVSDTDMSSQYWRRRRRRYWRRARRYRRRFWRRSRRMIYY